MQYPVRERAGGQLVELFIVVGRLLSGLWGVRHGYFLVEAFGEVGLDH